MESARIQDAETLLTQSVTMESISHLPVMPQSAGTAHSAAWRTHSQPSSTAACAFTAPDSGMGKPQRVPRVLLEEGEQGLLIATVWPRGMRRVHLRVDCHQ